MTSDKSNVIGSECIEASQGKKATFEKNDDIEQRRRKLRVYRKLMEKVMDGRRFCVIPR
jgi:hypothetical protein